MLVVERPLHFVQKEYPVVLATVDRPIAPIDLHFALLLDWLVIGMRQIDYIDSERRQKLGYKRYQLIDFAPTFDFVDLIQTVKPLYFRQKHLVL